MKLISLSDSVANTEYSISITQDARQAVLAGMNLGSGSDTVGALARLLISMALKYQFPKQIPMKRF